jgi:hypothetical protein
LLVPVALVVAALVAGVSLWTHASRQTSSAAAVSDYTGSGAAPASPSRIAQPGPAALPTADTEVLLPAGTSAAGTSVPTAAGGVRTPRHVAAPPVRSSAVAAQAVPSTAVAAPAAPSTVPAATEVPAPVAEPTVAGSPADVVGGAGAGAPTSGVPDPTSSGTGGSDSPAPTPTDSSGTDPGAGNSCDPGPITGTQSPTPSPTDARPNDTSAQPSATGDGTAVPVPTDDPSLAAARPC